MPKFVELIGYPSNRPVLVSIDRIVSVDQHSDHSRIHVERHSDNFSVWVHESVDAIHQRILDEHGRD